MFVDSIQSVLNNGPFVDAAVKAGIGLLGTVFGVVWNKLEHPIFKTHTYFERYSAVTGAWEGYADQPNYGRFEISLDLVATKKTIKGKGVLRRVKDHDNERSIAILLSGAYFDRDYVRLEYKPSNGGVSGFGVILMKLDEDERALIGSYAGCGVLVKQPVAGTVQFQKIS